MGFRPMPLVQRNAEKGMKNLTKEGVKAILGRSIVGTEPYDLAHALLEQLGANEANKVLIRAFGDRALVLEEKVDTLEMQKGAIEYGWRLDKEKLEGLKAKIVKMQNQYLAYKEAGIRGAYDDEDYESVINSVLKILE